MQGYDSVAVEADVEIGGTDQRFNLLAGRVLQEKYDQDPQSIIMGPLINGLDGRKMSSSWGNTINLTAEPADMYGKVMSVLDELVPAYFELCTRVPMDEVREILKSHPKETKMRLAFEIVKLYHGKDAAEEAQESFEETFSKGGVPKDLKSVRANGRELIDILLDEGLVASKTEFNRLNKEGAIKELESGIYRIGKHRFIKIERV